MPGDKASNHALLTLVLRRPPSAPARTRQAALSAVHDERLQLSRQAALAGDPLLADHRFECREVRGAWGLGGALPGRCSLLVGEAPCWPAPHTPSPPLVLRRPASSSQSFLLRTHSHTLLQCLATLPTARLLDLHVSELHDSFFAAQAARRMPVRGRAPASLVCCARSSQRRPRGACRRVHLQAAWQRAAAAPRCARGGGLKVTEHKVPPLRSHAALQVYQCLVEDCSRKFTTVQASEERF